MRILLLGANGQLGQELSCALAPIFQVQACGREQVDLTNESSITVALDEFQPTVIINAAAYTAVDRAENEQEIATQVNSDAVAVLAKEAARRNIWLIHYSTDYVFNGAKNTTYTENDPTYPINIYGASKLAGEQAILNSDCNHFIFRVSWVIGVRGQNFAKTILRLAQERNSLNVVNDQRGVPTTPRLIAKVTVAAIEAIATEYSWPCGLYHLSPHGETSWFCIANTVLKLANEQNLPLLTNESSLYPIKTVDYPTLANRPMNSLLSTEKIEQYLDFDLPNWEEDFCNVVKEIIKDLS